MRLTNTVTKRNYKTKMANGSWVTVNGKHLLNQMHFVKIGKDDYYVTVYDNTGAECAGYDRRTIGPRMIRCLATYTNE